MPPSLRHLPLLSRDFDPGAPSAAFSREWSQPSNYAFTILLLLGGDVVSAAMGQLAGGLVTPVAFSFGWVSYAITAMCSSIGEYRIMPGADTPCNVINGKNGFVRGNNSFVLGRIMRDYESWMNGEIRSKTQSLIRKRWDFDQDAAEKDQPGSGKDSPRPTQAGLVVSIWQPSQTIEAGRPGRDLLYWSGIIVSVAQLGIAAIPCGITGDWGVLLVTAAAMILCFSTGALRQWRVEKWACRRLERRSKKSFVLTRGNGAQHAIAIIGNGHGLDLEDLATGFANQDYPSITVFARLATIALGILWVALLITSSAIMADAWYLIAVGGIGMLQNIFAAAWKRTPHALGVPLDFIDVIGEVKVMNTLLEVEKKYEMLGRSMLGTFFPGDLRESEVKHWDALAEEWKEKKSQAKGEKENEYLK